MRPPPLLFALVLILAGCPDRDRDPAPPVPAAPPVVSSVNPAYGPATGGTAVTVSGTGFASGAVVRFGGVAATIASTTTTAIAVLTPAHAPGVVAVAVTNPDAQVSSLAGAFTYTVPSPVVASVTPGAGPNTGGTTVTITGASFLAGATVSIGGFAATSVVLVSSTTITCATPSLAPTIGAVNVDVTNAGASPGTLPGGFTAQGAAPTLTGVNPGTGPTTGGTAVTLTGTNFVAGATVAFDPPVPPGAPPNPRFATGVTVVSATRIDCVSPAGSGTVSVTITNADGQAATLAASFTYSSVSDTTAPTFAGCASAVAVSARAIELRWAAATDDFSPAAALIYEVHLGTTSGGQSFTAPSLATDPGVTSVVVGGLSPGTTWYAVVRCRDQAGNVDTNTQEQNATTPSGAGAAWVAAGALPIARSGHTLTPLPDGRILAAGGAASGGTLTAEALYDPWRGSWTATGLLNGARSLHSMHVLNDGRVLAVAGRNGQTIGTAELWAPATGIWTATSAVSQPRHWHRAVLLGDGRVLVGGGEDDTGPVSTALSSSEVYNPATGTWASAGTMNNGVMLHTFTLLADGRVLSVGGTTGNLASAGAELWSPTGNSWTTTGSLGTARGYHTATRLPDGRVLVAGGVGTGGVYASCEIYDSATGTWTAGPLMSGGRYGHTAARLPDGRIAVLGGGGATAPLASVDVFDPVAGTWGGGPSFPGGGYPGAVTIGPDGRLLVAGGTGASGGFIATTAVLRDATPEFRPAGTLNATRAAAAGTLLPDGRLLVAGGWDGAVATQTMRSSAEIFDPSTGTWTATGALATGRRAFTCTLLPTGRVLAMGGETTVPGNETASAELFDPVGGTWTATGTANALRASHVSVPLRDGRVLVAGGIVFGSPLASAEIYDPSTGAWTATGAMSTARGQLAAVGLADGRVLAIGGGASVATSAVEIFDPSTGAWTTAASLAATRMRHTATLLADGRVLVAGGDGSTGFVAGAEVFDPFSGAWTSAGTLTTGRNGHVAARLADGRVVVTGGYAGGSGAQSASEVYDPIANTWTAAGALGAARDGALALPLPDGGALIVGGSTLSVGVAASEALDAGHGVADPWRPRVDTAAGSSAWPVTLPAASLVTVQGARLRHGLPGGTGGGNSTDTGPDAPVVVLEGPIGAPGGGVVTILPARDFAGGASLRIPTPAAGAVAKGHHLLRVIAGGVPSAGRIVRVP